MSSQVEELEATRIATLEAQVTRLTEELLDEHCRAEVREAELEREVAYLRSTRRYLLNAMRAVEAEDASHAKG